MATKLLVLHRALLLLYPFSDMLIRMTFIFQQTATELNTWRILNLVRGVMAILGWIVISLRPNTDRLVKNLQKAEENMLGEPLEVIKANGA